MQEYEFKREYSSTFIGRESELRWLDERLFRASHVFAPIVISGKTGIGKTALIEHWLSSRRISSTPLFVNLSSEPDPGSALNRFIQVLTRLNKERFPSRENLIVVIDGSDTWDEKEHDRALISISNFKMVSALVFTRQEHLSFRLSENLHLAPLSENVISSLLEIFLNESSISTQVSNIVEAAKGNPLALSILTELLKSRSKDSSFLKILQKPLYELSNNILVPKKDIITVAQPIILSANNYLITALQKQPGDLHKLSPRDFEKLLADLLSDMGWEVELTKQTRDGGADILAYLNTDIGRLLCLVEAKHYSQDRKIGVDLVRTLYGTLFDAQANSAMMVTSSTFTKDAKEFQQKHQYQLTLRDYADIVTWILKYGNKQKSLSNNQNN